MYLEQTETPSFNTNNLWLKLSNHIYTYSKNETYRIDKKINDLYISITSNITEFKQKDKLIFELCLYQWQLKKYPDILEVDINQLCLDMNYKPHQHKKRYLFDRLKAFSSFRIEIVNPNMDTITIDFANIVCSLDENSDYIVQINFARNKKNLSFKNLFPSKNTVKKYLLPLKSEYQLLISEFLQMKTKMIGKNHPYTYRYRNFKLRDILDYVGLLDEYNLAGEFFNTDKQEQIRGKIAKHLRNLYKYGKENNIPIPKYRYNHKSKMYEIKDHNYPDQKTQKEILKDILEHITPEKDTK